MQGPTLEPKDKLRVTFTYKLKKTDRDKDFVKNVGMMDKMKNAFSGWGAAMGLS